MSLTLVTPPAVEPVSLGDLKAHLRVDVDKDDLLINRIGIAAREHVEEISGQQLIQATYDRCLTGFPSRGCEYNFYQDDYRNQKTYVERVAIRLPKPPLVSITSISYVDENGTPQVLSSSNYQVDAKSRPGFVVPAYGLTWPGARRQPQAVTVRFVAGHSATAAGVPEIMIAWICLVAGALYEYREPVITGTIQATIEYLDSMFWSHRFVTDFEEAA